jgi:hypothetical protein
MPQTPPSYLRVDVSHPRRIQSWASRYLLSRHTPFANDISTTTAAAIRTSAGYSRRKLSLHAHGKPHHRNLQNNTWSVVQCKTDVRTTFLMLPDCDLR